MAEGSRPRPGANLALLAAAGRHEAPVMLLSVTILGVAGAWRALTPGMVGWDFAGDALLDSVRGSGPVAAGLAAWLTIRSERSGLGRLERLGHRSAAAGPLTRLGIAASAALAGYALTVGAVSAWIGMHNTIRGSLQAREVAAGAAALLVHVTVGFLVALLCCAARYPAPAVTSQGRRSRPSPIRPSWARRLPAPPGPVPRLPALREGVARLPAPRLLGAADKSVAVHAVPTGMRTAVPTALAAVIWALDTWSGGWSGGAGWTALLLSPDVHHSPFAQWRPGLFTAALTWFCGLAAASVLASSWALTRRHRYAITFAAAGVVAGVGLGQLRSDAADPTTAVSASAVCRSWPLEVCVNPAFAAALPQLELTFTAVAAQVSGTRAAIGSVTQLPPGTSVSSRPGGYGFHLDDLGQGYALRAESDLVRQVAGALNRATQHHRPATADIDHRARSARPPVVQPVCRRHVPYPVEDGLELADMCTQGAHHIRPGRAQPP